MTEEFNNIFDFEKIDQSEFDEKKFWDKFIPQLQKVLDNRFGVGHYKSKIKVGYKSINCGCPRCGDGKHLKRRFHVYMKTYSTRCFNDCSRPFSSLYDFIKEFNIQDAFTESELFYIKNAFEQAMKDYQGLGGRSNQNLILGGNTTVNLTDTPTGYEKIQSKPEIDEYAFPREEIMKERKLREVKNSRQCIDYLLKRKIIKAPIDVYNETYPCFAFNDYYQDLYIFNLASNKKDILGIQIRHLSEKSRRRFTSITWGDIWKDIFKLTPPNEEELRMKFDKMSMMWNVLHINFNRRFYILEGAIDAYQFSSNAMACLGLSNFVYNKSAYYITDNSVCDMAGKKKAVELLDGGYNTFLWGKFTDDYPEIGRNYKDINDIVKAYPNFDFRIFDNYFGNDPLDTIWL